MQRTNSVGTLDSPGGTNLVAQWAAVLEKPLAVCYIYCSLYRKLLQEVNVTTGLTLRAPSPTGGVQAVFLPDERQRSPSLDTHSHAGLALACEN